MPYVLSHILAVPISTTIILVYSFYVLLQALILKRDFKLFMFLQVVFVVIFGYLVDFFKFMLGGFRLPGYVGQLGMVVFSAVCIGVSVGIYLCVEVMPLPMEGLAGAVTAALRGKAKFSTVKMSLDCGSVFIAFVLSLIFLGKVDGIREGTVITALLLGPIVGLTQKYITPSIRKVVFPKTTVGNV